MRRTQTWLAVLACLAVAAVPGACGKDGAGSGGAAGGAGGSGTGTGGSGQTGGGGVLGMAGSGGGGPAGSGGSGGTMGVAGAPGGRGGGGIGGRGGGSGSGGSVAVGGSGGSGGSALRCDTSWPVGCTVTAVCGNGKRDTCMGPAGLGPDCPLATFGELCEGNDLGGATCQQQGFASGTLTCLPTCKGFDVSRCSYCAAGPGVLGCGPVPMSATPLSMAIDASDDEIGVAWVEKVGDGKSPKLWFARLAPNLDLIDASQIADAAVAAEVNASSVFSVSVAVAPLPSGWVLAGIAVSHLDLFLHVFDGAGNHVSRLVLDDDETAYVPLFASRPNGGPLLVWSNDAGVHATLVSSDGLTTTTPIDLHVRSGEESAEVSSVAFAGDVFYVLLTVRTPTNDAGWLRWARVSTSGALLGFAEPPRTLKFLNPYLVTGGTNLRIVFDAIGTPFPNAPVSIVVQPFNPTTGAELSPPRVAGTHQQSYNYGKGIAFGDDTFFVLSGGDGIPFDATRLAPNGNVVTPAHPVAVRRVSYQFATVKRGTDAIVAWTGSLNEPEPITISRLVP